MPETVRPLIPVAFHTLAIYVFLIVALRATSRRQLGQLTVIDLTVVILLGSAVETAMVHANTSLSAGLVSASVLLITNAIFGKVLVRSRHLRHIVQSGPVLLVHDGQFVEEHLKRMGLTHENVLQALREHECSDIKTIKFAVLETDGVINVVPAGPGKEHDPIPSPDEDKDNPTP